MSPSVKVFMAIVMAGGLSHLSAARADSFDVHVGRGGVAFGMDIGMPPPVRVIEVPAYPSVRYVQVPAYRAYVVSPPAWGRGYERRDWYGYPPPMRYRDGDGYRYHEHHHEDDDD